MGQLYLSNVDFLKNGVPASIIAAMVSQEVHDFPLRFADLRYQVVATVGYLLMRAIGCVL